MVRPGRTLRAPRFSRGRGSMKIRFRASVCAILIALPFTVDGFAGPVTYVDGNAAGDADGTSWADAFVDLRAALDNARSNLEVRQIWVAAGTYRPDVPGGDRLASFELVNRVTLFGGFSGNETEVGERRPLDHRSVLSGDLNGNDDEAISNSTCCRALGERGCNDAACQEAVCAIDPFCCNESWDLSCVELTECACGNLCSTFCDNSYHVVTSRGANGSAMLDGFVITAGRANGDVFELARGAGMIVEGGGPTVRNCTFIENHALTAGGAIYQKGTTRIVNCRFLGNSALAGGAVFNEGAGPQFTNCVFSGNTAGDSGGGAMGNLGSSPTIVNCAFSANRGVLGGGIRNLLGSGPAIVNSIFWGNTDITGQSLLAQIRSDTQSLPAISFCIVQGIPNGLIDTISGRDPRFIEPLGEDGFAGSLDDDLRLKLDSPAIDAGSNGDVPPDVADLDEDGNRSERTPVDLDGTTRFFEEPNTPNTGEGSAPFVDLGPYEVASDCNRNSVLDDEDVADRTSEDCNRNEIPDECEIRATSSATGGPYFCTVDCNADCDNDGRPDDCQPDDDADGVINPCDRCPGTPPQIPVDVFGCTLRGACCFTAGVCFNDLADFACRGLNGNFLGYGLTCSSDLDEDGVRGCADRCPDDPHKSQPGDCGCGVPDTDTDGDGSANCIDLCPLDNPNDTDGDGTCDSLDPCPLDHPNDTDGDGICDSEDPCPSDNPDDFDGDGVCNSVDGCPADPLKTTPGLCGCGIRDNDSDQDGVVDCHDLCPQTPPGFLIDDEGCPTIGACCFHKGVCANAAYRSDCRTVGGMYQGNRTLCSDGCARPGDMNKDGLVNLMDYGLFFTCQSRGVTASAECDPADFDVNNVLDLRDMAEFQNAFDP